MCYSNRPSNIPNYKFYFTKAEDALRVLNGLKDIIVMYGVATVADLKDLAGVGGVGSYTDNKYGWVNSKSMAVRQMDILDPSHGYMLYLPKPFLVDDEAEPHVVLNFHANAPYKGGVELRLKSETPEFKSALPKAAKDAKIQKAYNVLTKALFNKYFDEDDLASAMEEAIGYLGEVLE